MADDPAFDYEEDQLLSPPSWERLAAMIDAGTDDVSDDDEDVAHHVTPIDRDSSVDNMANIDDIPARTSRALDLYLNGRENDDDVFQDDDVDYISVVQKGCMVRQPVQRRNNVNISDENCSKFIVERVEEIGTIMCDSGGSGAHRARTPSHESVYDTVSSTSSSAPLLRKITEPHTPTEPEPEPKPEPKPDATLGSIENIGKLLLARTLEQVKRSLEDITPTKQAEAYHLVMGSSGANKVSKIYLKNLVVLSLSFMVLFTAFFSLRNLQSSIHHQNGLGLAGLSSLSASYILFCLVAPSLVHKFRPKNTIIVSMVGHILFQVANFYPNFYTIIPASILLGCSMSALWVAQGTYITSIAVTYASAAGKTHEAIIGLFNGFFLFWLQFAQILGNLLSSFVLNLSIRDPDYDTDVTRGVLDHTDTYTTMEHDDTTNVEWYQDITNRSGAMCGAKFCHRTSLDELSIDEDMVQVDATDAQLGRIQLYVLLSVFVTCTVFAMGLTAGCLDKLDVIFHKRKVTVCQQLNILGRFHTEYKTWLLMALFVFLGMQQAYVFGELTKAYITCPLGIHMIGYVMVCFGACDSLTSFAIGQLQKYTSSRVIVSIGAVVHAVLLVLMLMWEPSRDEIYLIFILAGFLGAADAIWQTQICNLVGCLFPNDREAAFACLRMYEGVGFTVAFAYAHFLCMAVKTYILLATLMVAMITYHVLEHVEKRRRQTMGSYPPVDV